MNLDYVFMYETYLYVFVSILFFILSIYIYNCISCICVCISAVILYIICIAYNLARKLKKTKNTSVAHMVYLLWRTTPKAHYGSLVAH